jgi:hypothetical protein
MPPDSAVERTRLSWRRTTLAGTAVMTLMIRLALLHDNRTVALATSALGALCWAALLIMVQRRIRSLGRPGRPSRRILVVSSAACACFGVLGVVLVLA